MTTPQSNKRKRGGADSAASRPSPAMRGSAAPAQEDPAELDHYDEGAIGQLIAHNSGAHENHQNGGEPTATDTAAAALNHYQMGTAGAHYETPASAAEENAAMLGLNFVDQLKTAASIVNPADDIQNLRGGNKPPVGSDEWHKIRRDNHKEVERRRREAINEGINELSKIVPGCEKNKGSILQRAVQYIGQLKENEAQNIEKWTLEKLLVDQTITELSATCERLKNERTEALRELDAYKRVCQERGIVPPELEGLENDTKDNEN